jgi:hypothetical protein
MFYQKASVEPYLVVPHCIVNLIFIVVYLIKQKYFIKSKATL